MNADKKKLLRTFFKHRCCSAAWDIIAFQFHLLRFISFSVSCKCRMGNSLSCTVRRGGIWDLKADKFIYTCIYHMRSIHFVLVSSLPSKLVFNVSLRKSHFTPPNGTFIFSFLYE